MTTIQTLRDGVAFLEQRTKINANFEALDATKYEQPAAGIPAADMDAAARAALARAALAVQNPVEQGASGSAGGLIVSASGQPLLQTIDRAGQAHAINIVSAAGLRSPVVSWWGFRERGANSFVDVCTGSTLSKIGTGNLFSRPDGKALPGIYLDGATALQSSLTKGIYNLRRCLNLASLTAGEQINVWGLVRHAGTFDNNMLMWWGLQGGTPTLGGWGLLLNGSGGSIRWSHIGPGAAAPVTTPIGDDVIGDDGTSRAFVWCAEITGAYATGYLDIRVSKCGIDEISPNDQNDVKRITMPRASGTGATGACSWNPNAALTVGAACNNNWSSPRYYMSGQQLGQFGFSRGPARHGLHKLITNQLKRNPLANPWDALA